MPRRRYLLYLLPALLAALSGCNNSVFLSPDEIPGDFQTVTVAPGDSVFIAAPLKGCSWLTLNDFGKLSEQFPGAGDTDAPPTFRYIGGTPPYTVRAWRSVMADDPEASDPSHDWNLDMTVRADSKGVWVRVDQSLSPFGVEGQVEFNYGRDSYFIPLVIKGFPRLEVTAVDCSGLVLSGSGDVIDETERFTLRNAGPDSIGVNIAPFRQAKGSIIFIPSPAQPRLPLADSSPALRLPVPGADGSGVEWVDGLAPYVAGSQPLPSDILPPTVVTIRVPPMTTRRYSVFTSFHTVTATYVATACAPEAGHQEFSIRGKLVVKRPTDFIISYEDL